MIRALLGVVTAFVLCLLCAPIVMRVLTRKHVGQPILHYVDNHAAKQGTPTMGGVMFLIAITVATLTLLQGSSRMAGVCLGATLAFGLVGFLDDYIKIRYKKNKGLAAYQKIIAQLGIAALAAWYCYTSEWIGSTIVLPFTHAELDIGWWIIPLAIVVMLAATNSVNLTDGLDGLAGSTVATYFVLFGAVVGCTLLKATNDGMGKAYLDEVGNVLLLCGATVGALLAFLLYNANPAKVFMGDTGSLALGGAVGMTALCTKNALLLLIFGITFVWSSISVILQVVAFKVRKKRIFLIAPFHHHLERKGWSETRICALYCTVTLIVGVAYVVATNYFGGW